MPKFKRKIRKCVICGARVTNQNPLTTTCDGICTRARNNNISRFQQVIRDMEREELEEKFYGNPTTQGILRSDS
jgi:hypothetical protein